MTAKTLLLPVLPYRRESPLKLSIYAQAPLHPRRTLHQYRYGTIKSTKKLDKTQVVYRRTAPLTEYLHHPACKEKDRQKCQHAHCEEESEENIRKFRDCRQCFSDSQKLPRLIMVDQLWLWVLDGRELSLYRKCPIPLKIMHNGDRTECYPRNNYYKLPTKLGTWPSFCSQTYSHAVEDFPTSRDPVRLWPFCWFSAILHYYSENW